MASIKWQTYTKSPFIFLFVSSILCGLLNFPLVSHARAGKMDAESGHANTEDATRNCRCQR